MDTSALVNVINTDPFLLFFGTFYIIMGLSFIFAKEQWEEFMDLFVKHDAISLFLGIVILPISLSIILFYNNWDPLGSTILMALGYVGVVKAFILLLRPAILQSFVKKEFVQKWMWLDGVSGVTLGAAILVL